MKSSLIKIFHAIGMNPFAEKNQRYHLVGTMIINTTDWWQIYTMCQNDFNHIYRAFKTRSTCVGDIIQVEDKFNLILPMDTEIIKEKDFIVVPTSENCKCIQCKNKVF